MPPPIPVDLVAHDPSWLAQAAAEADRILAACRPALIAVHHIGSTAILGLCAKPILDLLPVMIELHALECHREKLEAMGYVWWGELGLAGRRYLTRDDPVSGRRLFQLHAYEQGSQAIVRHLAFRDHLRTHRELAAEYECEKRRCAKLHRWNSHDYTDCKDAWIRKVEMIALAARRDSSA